MKALLIIALAIVSLTSCRAIRSSQETVVKEQLVIKDSTVYNRVQVLDTLKVQREVVNGTISVEILEQLKEWKLQEGRAKTTIIYRDGLLDVQTECDSMIHVYVREELEQFFSSYEFKNDQQIKTKTVVKTETNFWKLLKWFLLSGVIGAALVLAIIYKSKLSSLWTRLFKKM